MTLQDIFDQLSSGELLKLSIGGDEEGGIQPENYQKVINHINLGLLSLYTRFHLKEGRVTIRLHPSRLLYPLTKEEMYHTQKLGFCDEEFEEDIIKVESVLTDGGMALALNDANDLFSCHTPTDRLLRLPCDLTGKNSSVPHEIRTDFLTVVYRAKHKKIEKTPGNFSPASVQVDLPETHLWALLLFVASRAHNPVGMSNEFHAGNSYYNKYEAECQLLEANGLQIDQGYLNTRLKDKGWI